MGNIFPFFTDKVISTPAARLFMIYDSYQETEGLKTSIDANG